MHSDSYSYDKQNSTRYTFISKGRKGAIVKIVELTPTSVKNLVNLGFGDLLPDGKIDDVAHSNNGDIIKVLATVIAIVKDFTNEHPAVKIIFTGSTEKRTELYRRILEMYDLDFTKGYIVTALLQNGNESYIEVPFQQKAKAKYIAFFIRKK